MKTRPTSPAAAAVAVTATATLLLLVRPAAAKWVDMTYTLGDKISVLPVPGFLPFKSKVLHRGATAKGYWYEANEFCVGEHRGTHFDAPVHFYEKGWSAEQVPVERLFMAPIVRVDISAKAQRSSSVFLAKEDLAEWEAKNGQIPAGSVVILYSGWGQHQQNPYAYYGTSTPLDASTYSFPGFHPDAAKWLVESRDVAGVGTDAISIESPKTAGHAAHRILAAANKYNLEQLAAVDAVPDTGAYLVVGPVKIRGGSGGPARVLALAPPFAADESEFLDAALGLRAADGAGGNQNNGLVVTDWAYDLAPDTVRWPTATPFRMQREPPPPKVDYWLLKNNFCLPEHIGTHIDAPVHFSRDALSSADIEIEHFIADGIVIDVEEEAKKNPDFVLEERHVLDWESRFDRIPEGSVVFLKSGWGAKLPDWTDYYGTPDYNDTTKLHFPGFSLGAAKLLVEERSVDGLAVDTPSIDPGTLTDFPVHQFVGQNDVYGLENVAGLARVPAGRYKVVLLPVKVAKGSGGPTRVYALVPPSAVDPSTTTTTRSGAGVASRGFLAAGRSTTDGGDDNRDDDDADGGKRKAGIDDGDDGGKNGGVGPSPAGGAVAYFSIFVTAVLSELSFSRNLAATCS